MIGYTNWFGARRAQTTLAMTVVVGMTGLGASVLVASAEKATITQPVANPVSPQQTVSIEELSKRANQSFNLTASKIISLDIDPTPDQPINTAIAVDGQAYTLSLSPHSIRAAGYRLRAQIEDGSYIDVDPGPDRTLRGTLIEAPGSRVAGSLLDDGLHAAIRMPDGQRLYIEPMFGRVPGAAIDHYVMYESNDVIHPNGFCGMDEAFLQANPPGAVPQDGGEGGPDGAAVYCAEIAVDADFEYFIAWGSNVTNVQNRVMLVLNTVNNQYINEVDIQFVITQIIVRTAEPDPYSSTIAETLLSQFQNHWNTAQGGVPRDVAHLFTGKNISGGTIGIAYLGTVCNLGSAYSLVQSDCCGSLACATDLSSHELGHNWGAPHCSCPGNTMNPSITCANVHAASSISAIVNYRNSVSCDSACADATLPFFDDFPSTVFDSTKWTTIQGAVIDTVGVNEPSAPYSMRLRGNSSTGGNQVRSSRINTTGLALLQLEYYYQRGGGGDPPETGDNLLVEYFNNVGNWVQVSMQPGGGGAMTNYAVANASFPADAMHSEFRMRFRVTSSQTNLDDWFVDNVNLTGVPLPANDNCANATLKGAGSHAFTTLGATTDGPTECTFNGYSQIGNDVWFKFLAQCTGTATASTCGANFNSKLAVYSGCPSGPGQAIVCNDDFCGNAAQVSFPVNGGTLYWIRIGGFNGATGSGTLVLSCTPGGTPCPADINDDNVVNVSDMLAVINAWGPCAGCPADVNNDGNVNVTDMLAVINAWGACPP